MHAPGMRHQQAIGVQEAGAPVSLRLGSVTLELTDRPLVMGILNRTRDSFYDGGQCFALDDLLRRAERLVADGADLLEVGARAAGVGARDIGEDEEAELVVETLAALRARLDAPLCVDTWRAPVAAAAFAAGAVLANDISGFSDPRYLPAAAAAGAAVVATHIRRAPQVPDPQPVYADVVTDVCDALRALVARAQDAGLPEEAIVVDPGLDLGKTWRQSLRLLAHLGAVAALGRPVLLAASHKIFLGRALGLPPQKRGPATVAACAFGMTLGARLLRVHDALGARHAAELFAALRAAT